MDNNSWECKKEILPEENNSVEHFERTDEGNVFPMLPTDESFNIEYNGKHPCDKCEYEATRADSLRSHIMAKHEGVKFECEQCAKTFSHQNNLIRHRRAVHTVV